MRRLTSASSTTKTFIFARFAGFFNHSERSCCCDCVCSEACDGLVVVGCDDDDDDDDDDAVDDDDDDDDDEVGDTSALAEAEEEGRELAVAPTEAVVAADECGDRTVSFTFIVIGGSAGVES